MSSTHPSFNRIQRVISSRSVDDDDDDDDDDEATFEVGKERGQWLIRTYHV